jgi:hypothetical protein
MKAYRVLYILLLAGLLVACNRNNPTQRIVAPREYTTAYVGLHGHCYDSIPQAVVSLDLYSEGLVLDSTHRMQGSGYNLYFSDMFVDSLLEAGTYRQDTTGARLTYLPGRDYEGIPSGAYLLQVNEGQLTQIQLIDSGMVVVRDTLDGQTDIQCTLYYGRQRYDAHFQGALTIE